MPCMAMQDAHVFALKTCPFSSGRMQHQPTKTYGARE